MYDPLFIKILTAYQAVADSGFKYNDVAVNIKHLF